MSFGPVWIALAAQAATAAATPPQKPPEASKEAATGVSAVVIKADAPPVRTSIDRRSYSVSGDLAAQSGGVADALRNIPSVEVDVQGNVSLRGDPNVTILIDGKPSGLLQGDNRGQALQQLPADRIERVEVITNPSAEFRSDGTGGVINLITKKAKGAGGNGSLRLTGGSSGRGGGSLSGGYNSGKLSASGDIGYRYDPVSQDDYERRQQPALDSETQGATKLDLKSWNGSATVDYDATDKLRVGGEARANRFRGAIDSTADTTREDTTGALVQAYRRDLSILQRRDNGALGLNLRRRFDGEGHELSLKLTYDVTTDERTRTGHTTQSVPAASSAFDQLRLAYELRQTDLKGDYVRPMDKGRTLKAGFDLQFDDNAYDNIGLRGGSLAGLVVDPGLTNQFLYEQALSQAYVTYEQPLGLLTALAGLRWEQSKLDLTASNRNIETTTSRLMPSLHLSYPLGDKQKLTASYSERLQRPSPFDLNPTPFLTDPLNYRIGNPALKPQVTHSYELGWQYRKAPLLVLATLYYRQNDKVMSDVVTDSGGGVFVTSRANVSQSRNGGLELVLNGKAAPTLTYNLSTNLYRVQLDGANLGIPGKRSATTVSGRASLNWQATPKDLIQLNGFLNSKRLSAQGYFRPSAALDLGYRHKIDDRLSLLVTVQDVLGVYREKQILQTPTLKSLSVRDPDARWVRVSLTWAFGAGKAKKDPGFDFSGGGAQQ